MSSNHQPQKLDKVWVAARREMGKQPNGYILAIIKESPRDMWPEEIIVKHFGNEQFPEEKVTYSWGEFDTNYVNETMGWMLEEL